MTLSVLAIETSTHACSATCLRQDDDGELHFFETFQVAPQKHTELLLPMLDEVLIAAHLSLNEIDILAYGNGPGAFTGVRIATSVIKAIAYTQDKPVASISSLACLAQASYRLDNQHQHVIVINDARMNEAYIACYSVDNDGFMQLFKEQQLVKPSEIALIIKEFTEHISGSFWFGVGSGWNEFENDLLQIIHSQYCLGINTELLPNAKEIAHLAIEKNQLSDLEDAFTAMPLYLRNNIAKPSVS